MCVELICDFQNRAGVYVAGLVQAASEGFLCILRVLVFGLVGLLGVERLLLGSNSLAVDMGHGRCSGARACLGGKNARHQID